MDVKTTTFLEYKGFLFSMAYNMLGNVAASEDLVQDTCLQWMEAPEGSVQHPRAYLVKIITNKCINYLQSARIRREEYIGIWLPEPLQDHDPNKVHAQVESWHALSIGMLVLLEKLTPRERAIFLLKEIFAYDHNELAGIFDITADNCRQILKRAKINLGSGDRRFGVNMKVHEKILHKFLLAISAGNMEDLIDVLKEDIILFADGDGKYFNVDGQRLTAFSKPIRGRENVGRLLLSLVPRIIQSIPDFSREIRFTNGLPSIVSYSGISPVSVVTIEPDDEQIRHIYIQTNPDKLGQFTPSPNSGLSPPLPGRSSDPE